LERLARASLSAVSRIITREEEMSQRIKTKTKRRRGFTYLWIFGLAVAIFLLIYFERTALLYISATLGVTMLLIIVATSDLGKSELSPESTAQMPDPLAQLSGAKPRK
jgi:amino acid permease